MTDLTTALRAVIDGWDRDAANGGNQLSEQERWDLIAQGERALRRSNRVRLPYALSVLALSAVAGTAVGVIVLALAMVFA